MSLSMFLGYPPCIPLPFALQESLLFSSTLFEARVKLGSEDLVCRLAHRLDSRYWFDSGYLLVMLVQER